MPAVIGAMAAMGVDVNQMIENEFESRTKFRRLDVPQEIQDERIRLAQEKRERKNRKQAEAWKKGEAGNYKIS